VHGRVRSKRVDKAMMRGERWRGRGRGENDREGVMEVEEEEHVR
jgi:hypothetical protein